MTARTPHEVRWLAIVEQLRDSPGITVSRDITADIDMTAGDVPEAFAELAEWEGIRLSSSLQENYLRFHELGSQWQTAEPYPFVAGEFRLRPIAHVIHEQSPDCASSLYSAEEREIISELRIIDEAPFTGAGTFSALRLQSDVEDPEIWYTDHRQGLWKMDLGYHQYFETLRLTRGAYDWQHLFTEAPLSSDGYDITVDRLTNMLDSLPRIFTEDDYGDLRDRWEARR
ncbi:hypothetical protein [Streptomyces yunnanensis]|uniref:Uncharacterized protein n=1 Tax=Streptomyces yunnanensis TaxID=156453 RepID=A0A9X8QV29_9ACTN|nr:hypothetical protein [Streptomyces yunnanensis]SHM34515.1 hypothetical protein SAMN05216268_110125 [Streptomyces yunnanensis]